MKQITTYCTGCRTCEQLCHAQAIAFQPDHEGFLQPVVDPERCTDCGLCQRRCPQNHPCPLNDEPLQTLAARLRDDATLFRSASGGAFAGLASWVIKQGGVVFGVAYDNQLRAHHVKAETIDELLPLLSSKYVQSDTEHTFTEVKRLLKEGRTVLYSGTGCQIGGLRAFLAKDYDNLLLVDLVCHGVPSPLLFARYLQTLEHRHRARITEYDFRDKRGGWGLGYKYKYKYKYKYGYASSSPYYRYFLAGHTYRECCYRCQYAQTHRPGDITMGDYWGLERFHRKFFDTRGVSLVLINSPKGQVAWQAVQGDFHHIESRLDYAIRMNGNLRHPTQRVDDIRNSIYHGIHDMDPDAYFAQRLPVHLSIPQRLKNLLPMKAKLALKKIYWTLKK